MKKIFVTLMILFCLSLSTVSAGMIITGENTGTEIGYDPDTVRHYTENNTKITEGWFILGSKGAQALRRVKVNDATLVYVIQESCFIRTDGRPTTCHTGFLKKEAKADNGSMFEDMLLQMIASK